MQYDDIFEMLEAVRAYQLRPRECLIPTGSVTGTIIGYTTADSDEVAIRWTIEAKRAKAQATARGDERLRSLLASHMGRKELLAELRKGTLVLASPLEPEQAAPEPEQADPVESSLSWCEKHDRPCFFCGCEDPFVDPQDHDGSQEPGSDPPPHS